ncbi:MAG: hypothetical protein V7L14_15115 [Nostoc sp.]|uniref:hypothetical protein n=1 Tax=Nostoc sp. TaxID=1180 RepID=UPI002FF95D96
MRLVLADLNPATNDDSDRSLQCNIGFGSSAQIFALITDGESVKVYINKATNSNYDSATN